MNTLETVHQKHIDLMQLTLRTVTTLVGSISQEHASTWRDGPDGWSVLEVLGHLRDFDGFFRGRAEMMLADEYPNLPRYDHVALAIERNYNRQALEDIVAQWAESRAATVALFEGLTGEQWERSGVHPERGHFTMTDAVMQIGHHDIIHTEQLAKILKGRAG